MAVKDAAEDRLTHVLAHRAEVHHLGDADSAGAILLGLSHVEADRQPRLRDRCKQRIEARGRIVKLGEVGAARRQGQRVFSPSSTSSPTEALAWAGSQKLTFPTP